MKKINALMLGAMALLLASCKSESSVKMFRFVYPDGQKKQIFADMQEDSLHLYSSMDWEAISEVTWIKLDPNNHSFKVPSGYIAHNKTIPVYFDQNKTNETREGCIAILGTDWDPKQSYKQVTWLDVRLPSGIIKEGSSVPTFEVKDSAHVTLDSVKFHINDKEGATIASNKEWVRPEKMIFTKGLNKTNIVMDPNTTGENRTAELLLKTKGGCETIILVTQTNLKK